MVVGSVIRKEKELMKNFKSKVMLAVTMMSVMISAIPIQAEVVGTDNNDQSISSSNLTLQ